MKKSFVPWKPAKAKMPSGRTFIKTIVTRVYFWVGVNVIGLPEIHTHELRYSKTVQL